MIKRKLVEKPIPYFYSENIPLIQKIFLEKLQNIELIKANSHLIKSLFFDIFSTDEFIRLYKKFAYDVAIKCYGRVEEVCLQSTPTPRIFFSGSHGTSIHCDYWYGHGESVFTTWVPIINCIPGATFYSDHFNSCGYNIKDKELNMQQFSKLSDSLVRPDLSVLPPDGAAYLFASNVLHGSTLNTSSKTRLSFDFRISQKEDKTSTKYLDGYYHYDNKTKDYNIPPHPLKGKPVLKYICGGKDKDTFSQHILIDAVAKRLEFVLVDQEAEIERYGHPILNALLKGYKLTNNYAAIAVSSSNILNSETIDLIKKSSLRVWSAMENKFI